MGTQHNSPQPYLGGHSVPLSKRMVQEYFAQAISQIGETRGVVNIAASVDGVVKEMVSSGYVTLTTDGKLAGDPHDYWPIVKQIEAAAVKALKGSDIRLPSLDASQKGNREINFNQRAAQFTKPLVDLLNGTHYR